MNHTFPCLRWTYQFSLSVLLFHLILFPFDVNLIWWIVTFYLIFHENIFRNLTSIWIIFRDLIIHEFWQSNTLPGQYAHAVFLFNNRRRLSIFVISKIHHLCHYLCNNLIFSVVKKNMIVSSGSSDKDIIVWLGVKLSKSS